MYLKITNNSANTEHCKLEIQKIIQKQFSLQKRYHIFRLNITCCAFTADFWSGHSATAGS